ncbi:unnamed protein product [Meganyctiphanes norvegica]|uniref:Auto-transporter adhesin head GIN domain-containing protein n=1 Tax=Meganyctiphanes norvegica TaxID=48144 RepID=A0AAV2RYR9_MEGNR
MIQETKTASSLNLSDGKAEVILIQDSSVGVISKGSLNFSSDSLKHILINNVTLGSIENEGISLYGNLKLRIMDSRIADMARDALVAQGSASIELTGNMVVARMKALTSLDCTQPAFHIAGNHIFLVPGSHGGHHIEWDDRTYFPSNDTKESDNKFTDKNDDLITLGPRELIEKTSAEKVLHPKCLNNNLPVVKPNNRLSHLVPVSNSKEKMMRGWLVVLASFLFVAIAVAGFFGYLLFRKRRQHVLRNRSRSETTLVSLVGNENVSDNIPWVNMDHPGHKHNRTLW